MDKSIEKILDSLPREVKKFYFFNKDKNITEIRIRSGFDIKICADGIYTEVNSTTLDEKQLMDLFYYFCDYTISAFENQIEKGFITLQGGHRIGIAGSFTTNNNGKVILQRLYSMNIRIAGKAKWEIPQQLLNTAKGFLIAGGPHSGKTTFIRSFCLLQQNKNIVICDERNEIYSPLINQDFLINISKVSAIEQAVRTMNPDIIICDEIGNEREATAILNAVNNGAAFICSVHASNLESLFKKPYIKNLIDADVFEKIVFLKNHNGIFYVEDIKDV